MAVSRWHTVYCAFFESGSMTTIVPGNPRSLASGICSVQGGAAVHGGDERRPETCRTLWRRGAHPNSKITLVLSPLDPTTRYPVRRASSRTEERDHRSVDGRQQPPTGRTSHQQIAGRVCAKRTCRTTDVAVSDANNPTGTAVAYQAT